MEHDCTTARAQALAKVVVADPIRLRAVAVPVLTAPVPSDRDWGASAATA